MMVAGFIISILTLTTMILGFVLPRYYGVFIAPHRRNEGTESTTANELKLEPVELVDSRHSTEHSSVEGETREK